MKIGIATASATAREMRLHAALVRLVVVGRNDQHRVGASLFGMHGKIDRLGGVVGAGACNDWHPAARDLDRHLDDVFVLVMAKRRRFAGCADRHQAAAALVDLPFDEIAERLLVESCRIREWRDQRGDRPAKLLHGRHC